MRRRDDKIAQAGTPLTRANVRTVAAAESYPADDDNATVFPARFVNATFSLSQGAQSISGSQSARDLLFWHNGHLAEGSEIGVVQINNRWFAVPQLSDSIAVTEQRVLHRLAADGTHIWSMPPNSESDRVYDLMVLAGSETSFTVDGDPAPTYLAVYYHEDVGGGNAPWIRLYGADGNQLSRFAQQFAAGTDLSDFHRNSVFTAPGGLVKARYNQSNDPYPELWRIWNAVATYSGDVGVNHEIDFTTGRGRGLTGANGDLYPVGTFDDSSDVALLRVAAATLHQYEPSIGSKVGRSLAEYSAGGSPEPIYLGTDDSLCKVTWAGIGFVATEHWINTADVGAMVPAVQCDSNGNVFAAVGTKVKKFAAATGALLSEVFDHGKLIRDLALDSDDNILLAGNRNVIDQCTVRKLDPDGEEIWKADSVAVATCIDVDRDNDSVYFGNI